MTVYPVTVNLTEPVYRRVKRAAERTQRSVEQLLSDALAVLTPETSNLPADLQTALAQMADLNDAALWQAWHEHFGWYDQGLSSLARRLLDAQQLPRWI